MGVDLEVSRAVPSLYAARYPLSEAEVVEYVERAPDMSMAPWLTPGIDFRLIEVADGAWTRYTGGMVAMKNPDDARCRQMAAMATALDAWLMFESVQIVTVEGDRVMTRDIVMADLPYPRYYLTRDAPIEVGEWAEVVAEQADFAWETRIEARLPSGRRWIDCPPVACWTGHPSGKPVPFHLDDVSDDSVDVGQPDGLTLERMRALAAVLGGWVSDGSGKRV
ncbi:hypothetical protein [Paractinoplanes atraurantiacus]|uniref:Uncharacterized protein n=1 Tax=Paractinoplanes atraurantiacus TaxID=1036182 RepID=A0A285IXH7_9ACTN|nr:hypothetical protein [Actinoplanes atraurantiacus]SNY52658.1 hypothetical protein SAMN05421748_11360 [Actinoplanes atraurantiacus]